MRTSTLALSLTLGFVLPLGCGNRHPLSASAALEQACTAYANIYRTREATCQGVTPEPDEASLIARQARSCVLGASAPGSMVDANYWNSCASAADNNCGGYKCATYPAGARQPGESCLVSTQCASLWCKGTEVTTADGTVLNQTVQCGTCSPRLTEGSPCIWPTDACEVGLSCFQGACRKQGLAGASCSVWNDCAYPWVCRSNGMCAYVSGSGKACTSSHDCMTFEACDLATNACVPAEFGQPGAMCDEAVHRCEVGYCILATGSCPAVLPDGAACDPSDLSAVCGIYARCFAGTCQIPDPADCG